MFNANLTIETLNQLTNNLPSSSTPNPNVSSTTTDTSSLSLLNRNLASNLPITPTNPNPINRKRRQLVPVEQKDDGYWIKRKKNNEAARRSREKRRANDLLIERKLAELQKENIQLKQQIYALQVKYGETPTLASANSTPSQNAAQVLRNFQAQQTATASASSSQLQINQSLLASVLLQAKNQNQATTQNLSKNSVSTTLSNLVQNQSSISTQLSRSRALASSTEAAEHETESSTLKSGSEETSDDEKEDVVVDDDSGLNTSLSSTSSSNSHQQPPPPGNLGKNISHQKSAAFNLNEIMKNNDKAVELLGNLLKQ